MIAVVSYFEWIVVVLVALMRLYHFVLLVLFVKRVGVLDLERTRIPRHAVVAISIRQIVLLIQPLRQQL